MISFKLKSIYIFLIFYYRLKFYFFTLKKTKTYKMDVKKVNIYFDKFVLKMNKINPNLTFNVEDWIPNDKKIKGYCNLHNIQFTMQRTNNCLIYNCPSCIGTKKYTKKEREDCMKICDEIDNSVKIVASDKKDVDDKISKTKEEIYGELTKDKSSEFIKHYNELAKLEMYMSDISRNIDLEKIRNLSHIVGLIDKDSICYNNTLNDHHINILQDKINWSTLVEQYKNISINFIESFYLRIFLSTLKYEPYNNHEIYCNENLTKDMLMMILKKESDLIKDLKLVNNNYMTIRYGKYLLNNDCKYDDLINYVKKDGRLINWYGIFNNNGLLNDTIGIINFFMDKKFINYGDKSIDIDRAFSTSKMYVTYLDKMNLNKEYIRKCSNYSVCDKKYCPRQTNLTVKFIKTIEECDININYEQLNRNIEIYTDKEIKDYITIKYREIYNGNIECDIKGFE